ncbi:hypothetical protein SAMN02745248_02769 [Hathewaya proteolytica DSM 3090]|uniref:Uncharacterized protein n=1 Tax=Hathewaya proteolytica DSM 3090 TaxID=1121331 RepID=A0A1M6TAW0_9CLOT|nr:hypothetical protein [Hathewaya proteolytica]SHK53888.1 hypothetical protein SAMN02745248_02769 [Hathewaya proteolytica DSM 3090]
MKALIIIIVTAILVVVFGSIIYLFKNKMFAKIKTYSTAILICGFLISCTLPLYSLYGFKEIDKIEERIPKYTEMQYRSKFEDEGKIKVKQFTILRVNFINIIILVCTVQYIYTLKFSIRIKELEKDKRSKEAELLPQKS